MLELILVMVIISTVLSMAAPSLRGFFSSRKTHDAASNILSLIRLVRSQAISEGRIYRLNLDPDEGAYWITVNEEGIFREIQSDFGRKFLLPEDMSVQLEKGGNKESPEKYVDFFPQGLAESCVIRLTDRRGDVLEIMSSSPAERYRVVIPEEVTK